MSLALLLAAAVAASPVTPAPTPAAVGGAAIGLFEKDWVLMSWAVKHHDQDRDGLLAPAEAVGAAAEFRNIADGDGDGRVSRLEYRQAREFIIARY